MQGHSRENRIKAVVRAVEPHICTGDAQYFDTFSSLVFFQATQFRVIVSTQDGRHSVRLTPMEREDDLELISILPLAAIALEEKINS